MRYEAVERIGLIPRSIIRTLDKLKKQLLPGVEVLAIEEYRISRYQLIVSVQSLLILFLVPPLVNISLKFLVIRPVVEHYWNRPGNEIFLNSDQKKRALKEFNFAHEIIYFDSLVDDNFFDTNKNIGQSLQKKIFEITQTYNEQSIRAITNLIADFCSLFSIFIIISSMKPQMIILQSFLAESLYSFSDTTKSFLLILGTDLLVGFHSPRGWNIFLKWVFIHFGFSESSLFLSLFVSTFPVFLDTIFKYWVFRSLNRISPSTVATYHNMLE